MEGFGWYTYEITKRLVENHPEVEFYFFFDRTFDKKFVFGKNVHPIVLSPPARHPLLFYIWFEWSVRKALKKYKIDVFFSPDGYLSLSSKVPQVSVIHDINFEHHPEDLPWAARIYLRHFFPKFAKKASRIITVSDYSRQDIFKTYGVSLEKIQVIWNGASDVFQPLDEDEQMKIRERYTSGYPFFLFVGSIHPRKNLQRLISAYSAFIDESETATQLLIVGRPLWNDSNITIPENCKDRIIFSGHLPLDELARVMGSAKALTFVPYFEGFGIPIVEAMRCGTPILSGNRTSLPEVAEQAAVYCDPLQIDSIKDGLHRLDNDESLRRNLSQLGRERSKLFSWDFAASSVWKVILETIKK